MESFSKYIRRFVNMFTQIWNKVQQQNTNIHSTEISLLYGRNLIESKRCTKGSNYFPSYSYSDDIRGMSLLLQRVISLRYYQVCEQHS